jgi:hypothetical protein
MVGAMTGEGLMEPSRAFLVAFARTTEGLVGLLEEKNARMAVQTSANQPVQIRERPKPAKPSKKGRKP